MSNKLHHSNKIERKMRKDFVFFLKYMFKRMGLPAPTPMQLLLADMLQRQLHRREVYLVYRGFGKSLIMGLFLLWKQWNKPTRIQAIWGQNQTFAAESVGQILEWIKSYEEFSIIRPGPNQRQSTHRYDTPQKPPRVRGGSLNALSIGGAIVGSRANDLLIDDPETINNGYTQQRRENLDRSMQEATMVITQDDSRIMVIGTPHFDRSLYTRLETQGYKVWIFPMSVPSKEVADLCWKNYPKQIRDWISALPEDAPLDRFGPEEIAMRKSTGKIYYERQCLCNMYRSSATNRPLDISKIILFDANPYKLPTSFEHAREPQYAADDMAEFSCADIGERFYRPFRIAETVKPYEDKFVYVDPAGAGKDEFVFGSGGAANGYAVLFHVEGLVGGVNKANIEKMIDHAISIGATTIYWESNLNTGAEFCRAVMDEKYAPRFGRAKLPQIVPVHNQVSKNLRIETLDPIINSGRMIITPNALRNDFNSAMDRGGESFHDFTLTSQISNFSPSEELPFDDRIDMLAGLMIKLAPYLGVTTNKLILDDYYERIQEYLDAPIIGPETFEPVVASTVGLRSLPSQWRQNSTKRRGGKKAA